MYNTSSLYTCDGTQEYTFRPLNDTYPDKCDQYMECDTLGRVYPRQCANGTHFAWADPIQACANVWDKETFCNQMRRAEECQNTG